MEKKVIDSSFWPQGPPGFGKILYDHHVISSHRLYVFFNDDEMLCIETSSRDRGRNRCLRGRPPNEPSLSPMAT